MYGSHSTRIWPTSTGPAVGDLEPRAVDDRVALAVAPLRVLHDQRPGAVHDDALAGVVVPLALGLDDLEALVADRAGVLRVERGLLRHARRRAADVERPHRQLRARLADRLRGDDPDGQAELDQLAGREVAAVALRADAAAARARQHRADPDLLDAAFLDRRGLVLVDRVVHVDDHVARERVHDLLERDAADDAVAQRLDDLAALDDRLGLDAVHRAAVDLVDDDVLRHVDQPAGQVARVRRLERGVGEALARAVRRDEVLEHGQPFTEVRRDRRLDDLPRRLGHQAAHTGQLADAVGAIALAGGPPPSPPACSSHPVPVLRHVGVDAHALRRRRVPARADGEVDGEVPPDDRWGTAAGGTRRRSPATRSRRAPRRSRRSAALGRSRRHGSEPEQQRGGRRSPHGRGAAPRTAPRRS